MKRITDRTANSNRSSFPRAAVTIALGFLITLGAVAEPASKMGPAYAVTKKTFATAQEAVNALIEATEKFDESALDALFGPEGRDIVHSEDPIRDRENAAAFAAKAREKQAIAFDKENVNRAILSVGPEYWPFPVPIVRSAGKWSFDARAGRDEILKRRIGRNELDAISLCRGFVVAQHEYALKKRKGYDVNQYAQRIISEPGKQDGLAWQEADGSWAGPVGENVAKAIERGYTTETEPYNGYYFKVLKGQGPAAPLGQLDFVVKGAMIGGFALIAVPAQYRVTGVKTFMVSHDGVVYQKDLGPNTLAIAKRIDRFNPDRTWSPVESE
jgi:hypothetical protein